MVSLCKFLFLESVLDVGDATVAAATRDRIKIMQTKSGIEVKNISPPIHYECGYCTAVLDMSQHSVLLVNSSGVKDVNIRFMKKHEKL